MSGPVSIRTVLMGQEQRRALITGAAGFIGKRFASYLMKQGYEVVGVDPAFERTTKANEHPAEFAWDCRDFFDSVYADDHFDLVIHCAANVGGREKIDGDPMWVADDISIDVAAFRWAVQAKPDHFVYFSSSAAYPTYLQSANRYGQQSLNEFDYEGLIHEADQTYGAAKIIGEYLADRAREYGVKVYVFRPFSGYGPGQSLDYPFPSLIRRAIYGENPFEIWGDGQQVRDWIHIDDIIAAVVTALNMSIYGPVNLGTGVGTSFIELAKLMVNTLALGGGPRSDSIVFRTRLDKPAGVAHRVADPSLLNTFYKPKVRLVDGIREALGVVLAHHVTIVATREKQFDQLVIDEAIRAEIAGLTDSVDLER